MTGKIITPFAKGPTSIEEAMVGMGRYAHPLWQRWAKISRPAERRRGEGASLGSGLQSMQSVTAEEVRWADQSGRVSVGRSNTEIEASNPARGMDVCVCVALCVGSGLTTG
jgi:hypothetical protein